MGSSMRNVRKQVSLCRAADDAAAEEERVNDSDRRIVLGGSRDRQADHAMVREPIFELERSRDRRRIRNQLLDLFRLRRTSVKLN
jgi:hypothetical protein